MALEADLSPVDVNVKVRAGDGLSIVCTFSNTAGVLQDVSASTFVARLVELDYAAGDDVTLALTVDVTDAAAGSVTISATGAQTLALLAAGERSWRGSWMMVRTRSGGQPRTYYEGQFVSGLDVRQ